MYATQTPCLSCTANVQSLRASNKLVHVDLPLTKPCWVQDDVTMLQIFFALKLSDKALILSLMLHRVAQNAILCMILRITLDVNRKRIYQASRGHSPIAELYLFLYNFPNFPVPISPLPKFSAVAVFSAVT